MIDPADDLPHEPHDERLWSETYGLWILPIAEAGRVRLDRW